MNSATLTIWGRELNLRIEYDHYDDDVIPLEMQEALRRFLQSRESIEVSLPSLKCYCKKQNYSDIISTFGNDEIDDIYSIAMPVSICVLPSEENRRVSLMLDYRFDLEEGIGMLFENEKLCYIGTQSSVFVA